MSPNYPDGQLATFNVKWQQGDGCPQVTISGIQASSPERAVAAAQKMLMDHITSKKPIFV